jgi:hypothetical protein
MTTSASNNAPIIYCDWNVFNKLEHANTLVGPERSVYMEIKRKAVVNELIVPYSNAHISDLLRGYLKNPDYTPGHLENITTLTKNLCIAQYWGETRPRWHYRDPGTFLNSTLEEQQDTSPDFSSLYDSLDEPLLSASFEIRKTLLRLRPMPPAFQQIYQIDPVFNIMYPRTKIEMNMLAFCDDLYTFAQKIKTDFALYNQHKKMMINLKNRYPQLRKTITNTEQQLIGQPEYLKWDDVWEDLGKKFNASYNPQANQVMGLFTTTDLKGYRQDERFANMIDDSLHCFYAAHCDHFLTLDQRCFDKTILVYNKLKIATKVTTPEIFVEELSGH